MASLPVSCRLECSGHFSCSLEKTHLNVGEEIVVNVSFDAVSADTLYTSQHNAKLRIEYEQMDRTETVKLLGIINRPNLEFTKDEVLFCCKLSRLRTNISCLRWILDVFSRNKHTGMKYKCKTQQNRMWTTTGVSPKIQVPPVCDSWMVI